MAACEGIGCADRILIFYPANLDQKDNDRRPPYVVHEEAE